MSVRPLHHRGAVAALAAAALLLSACGGDSGGKSSESAAPATSSLPSVSADDALAALVPPAIAEDGVITVGSDTTYPPAEFIGEDGTTIVGFDVDLFALVAKKLGLKAKFETSPFD